jgi:hypothetical protein
MKFMTIIKGPELTEDPPQALIDAINAFGQEAKAAGVFVEWGGLQPTAEGSRVSISKGKLVVTDGPFTEAKEVIGGFAVYNVASKEEAMEWARRFMELHVKHWPEWEGEVEVRGIMFED